MSLDQIPVTVLIPTYNEERNLAACLQSVSWAKEIFVVDSYSNDNTENIAKANGAEFFQHPFENYAAQKNWALDNLAISQKWVLILDADERVSDDLALEIGSVLRENRPNGPVGYYINRRFIFMGRWIRHCGWYPSWNVRLFRDGRALYEERPVHEHMLVDGTVDYMKHDLIHDDQRGITAWLERHNQYSTWEAETRLRVQKEQFSNGLQSHWRGSPVERKRAIREHLWPRLPAKPIWWFCYLYLLRGGFLDGWQGFTFCVLQAVQEFHVGLKMREISDS